MTLAFIGTNLTEIVSPHGRGLGALFDSGKTNSDYPLMFAVLIALAVLGIALYYVVVVLEFLRAGPNGPLTIGSRGSCFCIDALSGRLNSLPFFEKAKSIV